MLAALLTFGATALIRPPAVAHAAPNPAPVSAGTTPAPARSTSPGHVALAATASQAGATARPPAPVALVFSSAWLGANPSPELPIRAESAILVDLDAKQVLWAREPHSVRAPASLTKLITAMVAADLGPLDMEVTVPAEATQVQPNVMGLSSGEVVTLRTLFYGLFLDSGNDAAETLARTLVPRDRFLLLMNQRAQRLGMRDTHFNNPSGLDDTDHHASAYDLAVAAWALVARYPKLAEIAGTKQQEIPAGPQHKAYEPYNLNKMLWLYPGATGLKTGFTDDAGGCVVVTASRGGRHLAAVVMHDDVFFTDAGRLLDYGWSVKPT